MPNYYLAQEKASCCLQLPAERPLSKQVRVTDGVEVAVAVVKPLSQHETEPAVAQLSHILCNTVNLFLFLSLGPKKQGTIWAIHLERLRLL